MPRPLQFSYQQFLYRGNSPLDFPGNFLVYFSRYRGAMCVAHFGKKIYRFGSRNHTSCDQFGAKFGGSVLRVSDRNGRSWVYLPFGLFISGGSLVYRSWILALLQRYLGRWNS